ncbi:MAG: multifunctional response regulator receiver/nitrate/sulfonate/bicarbonate ABC transporter substrate-binding protein [Desulfobacterium sp.]|nr:multifunctional response regulator receiver/nitrate/sulfonate/bicarbonate ABC transporter substrate-binding protein [Desulfobacterium sp.]
MKLDMTMKVMIVDDSGTMRNMMKNMVANLGFQNVIAASDGADAINKLKEQKIDLIISDWNMPKIDGMSLLKWVRNNPVTKNILFIMATAQGDKTQEKAVKDAGGNSHIAKPYTEEMLKEKIDEIFGLVDKSSPEKRTPKMMNGKVQMKIGHIQITDHLTLGILKHQINTGEVSPRFFDLETLCMPGWNPVQEALEKNTVDGAFVLAPIAMDLFGFNVPIQMVLLAHKNGSVFVRNSLYNVDDYGEVKNFFRYKVIDIPHKMSIHNMLAHKYLTGLGLKPGVPGQQNAINVRFEVVPPIQMPKIMKENNNVGGFIVAEPIGSNAIAKRIADLQFLSSEIWDNHPCCVTAMQKDFIDAYPEAVFEFTSLLVKAGKFIENHQDMAAEIAVSFLDPQKTLGLTTEVLKKVLSTPKGIKMNDLYPVLEDLDSIQRYMHDFMDIGVLIDIEKFVDLRFAEAACR